MARTTGALGALVTTGTHSASAAPPEQRPKVVVNGLSRLGFRVAPQERLLVRSAFRVESRAMTATTSPTTGVAGYIS